MNLILSALIGYLFGSIPYSYILPKLIKKIDIREHGSKNVGSTNVLRICGYKIALVALILDLTKGLIAVFIVSYFFSYDLTLVCAIFAILGHCYPFLLNFKGGKGVATAAGMILILNPKLFLMLAIIMFLLLYLFKTVSIASILTAAIFPIISIVLKLENNFILFAFFISFFIIYKHRQNIQRIIDGTENKINTKKNAVN